MQGLLYKFSLTLAKYSDYSAEVICFCIKLWMSIMLQICILITISILFWDIKYFVCFISVFVPLRIMFDGYHCSTFKKCLCLSTSLYCLICLFAIAAQYINVLKVFIILLILSANTYFLRYSINEKEKKSYSQRFLYMYFLIRIILLLCITAFFAYTLITTNGNDRYVWVSGCSFCVVYILSKGGEKNEKQNN